MRYLMLFGILFLLPTIVQACPLFGSSLEVGGAYTAVSDTPVGWICNPAGIALADGQHAEAANTYIKSSADGNDLNSFDKSNVTSFNGVMKQKPTYSYGGGFSVPNYEIIEDSRTQQSSENSKYFLQLHREYQQLSFFGGLAKKLNSNWSVGSTVLIGMDKASCILDISILLSGSPQDILLKQISYFAQATGVKAELILGAMYKVGMLQAGISVRGGNFLRSFYNENKNETNTNSITNPQAMVVFVTKDRNHNPFGQIPILVNFGSKLQVSPSFYTSGELNYSSAYGKGAFDGYEAVDALFNGSIGGSYLLSQRFTLSGGLFSTYASHTDLEGENDYYNVTTKGFGESLFLSYSPGKNEKYALGGFYVKSHDYSKADSINNKVISATLNYTSDI